MFYCFVGVLRRSGKDQGGGSPCVEDVEVAMPEGPTALTCWICDKPVGPEGATTDPLGYPVHQNCYADMMSEEKEKRKMARGPYLKSPRP
jgi:hypothetical protein